MNRKKITALILSALFVVFSFSACGDAKIPGEKNAKAENEAPETIELTDGDLRTEDVTAITAATDLNGKVVDNEGIIDLLGHRIYSTGQKNANGRIIYTTGKKDSKGNILYTLNTADSLGNLIYYTGTYDANGKLVLKGTNEVPDYTSNETPKKPIINGKLTTSATVKFEGKTSDTVIADAKCSYTKYFGGTGIDTNKDVKPCKDGGYIVVAQSYSRDGDYNGIDEGWADSHSAIIKYSVDGDIEWKYVAGGNGNIAFSKAAVLSDDTIVAVGYTSATDTEAKLNAESVSGVIYRFTADGELMWMYSFPSDGKTQGELINSVAATPDGGFVVGGKAVSTSGFFTGTSETGTKAFIFKFDKNCNVKWRKILTGTKSNDFVAIEVNSDGEIFAVCETYSLDGDFAGISQIYKLDQNSILLKLDKNGNVKWTKFLVGNGRSGFTCVTPTSDGGCVVGGTFAISKRTGGIYNANYGGNDGYLIRYNGDGDVYWSRILGGTESDIINGITAVDGGFAVVGNTKSNTVDFKNQKLGGDTDGFVFYINEEGKNITPVILNGSKADNVLAVTTLANGDVVICGATMSNDGPFEGSKAINEYMGFASKYVAEVKQ